MYVLYGVFDRVLDKSSKTIQYISVMYDIFTLGCSTFDLDENGTSSFYFVMMLLYMLLSCVVVVVVRVSSSY